VASVLDRPVVRRLRPAEWRTYRALRLAALVDAPHAFGSTLEGELARTEADWRGRLRRRVLFAALIDGVPVGTAGYLREGDGAELISMWVDPRCRGRGVGDDLVSAVVAWSERKRRGVLRLWVSEGNRPAERLYARHGFVRTGEVQPVGGRDPGRLEFAMARRQPAAERAGGGWPWRWLLPAAPRQPRT
jgi:GNAT superfamily N-acetyltransferase